MRRARYRVEHRTRYQYESTVAMSQHVAALYPRELLRQRVAWRELSVEPTPARSTRRVDYFGNTLDQLSILTPHSVLDVTGRSLVEVRASEESLEPAESPPWEFVRDSLRYRKGASYDASSQFAYASAYATVDAELAEFAGASFRPDRPFLEAAIDLMHRIHAEFRFDPDATTLTTPVGRVLREKRGVCQDFAHLEISCLRSLGLPARYVSGYLLTDPPPGKPRLVGADASHAWLAVHCPRHGWVDLDPTNDAVPDTRHVTVAWGRDYGDVSPLRGVILGGGKHTLKVAVSVEPLEDEHWDSAPSVA